MTHDARPLLAITMGDPAGIGPEIVCKALAHTDLFARCRPLVVGDQRVLARAAAWVGQEARFESVDSPDSGRYQAGTVPLLDRRNADPALIPVGEVSAAGGRAAVDYVRHGCRLAMEGVAAALVTAPINKAAIHAAGEHYPGHTELLAEQTGAQRITMLLVGPSLRVVHVSTHVALSEAIARITTDRVLEVIELAHSACLDLGISRPRIAVAGLNPHAGEGGLFGLQEAEQIQPAVNLARERGWTVSDPQPPDTVFLQATQGVYDVVVAMYHDQGHIPMKLLAFDSGVNVSMGLPILRTSVDHGTAFDIAGTGRASETSLLAAVDVALQLVEGRGRSGTAGGAA